MDDNISIQDQPLKVKQQGLNLKLVQPWCKKFQMRTKQVKRKKEEKQKDEKLNRENIKQKQKEDIHSGSRKTEQSMMGEEQKGRRNIRNKKGQKKIVYVVKAKKTKDHVKEEQILETKIHIHSGR